MTQTSMTVEKLVNVGNIRQIWESHERRWETSLSQTVQRAFYFEVQKQCQFVIMATQELENALQQYQTDRVFYAIQTLLVAAANISKIFWPPNRRYDDRGRQLRADLGVADNSVLALRTFRDHFEHYDERLETWASSSRRHNIVDTSVM